MTSKNGLNAFLSRLVIATGLLIGSAPSHAENPADRSGDRQDARDTRQIGRQNAREDKQDCKSHDNKGRPECRQDKRDAKQDARGAAKDIKRN